MLQTLINTEVGEIRQVSSKEVENSQANILEYASEKNQKSEKSGQSKIDTISSHSNDEKDDGTQITYNQPNDPNSNTDRQTTGMNGSDDDE